MAGIQLDTLDALMAHYTAGMLPEPARVLVEAHLDMQSTNRAIVAACEAIAGDALEAAEPVALGARDATLKAVFAAAPVLAWTAPSTRRENTLFPRAICDFTGLDADRIRWKRKLPGFKEHRLGKIDGCNVSFFWIRPGRAVPAHTHAGFELALVLDGAFNDGRGRFGKGDISVADQSVDHRPIAENECPCIGFAVSDAPYRLTGSLRQRIGDLIG